MKKFLLILFCSTLFAQNNLTGSIKLSKSEFSEDAKNSFNIDVMYNHYISNSTFLGIGYTQESLVFENLTTSLFDEDFDDIVSYHGLRAELNQELIKNDSFSIYGGVHYNQLWSVEFNAFLSGLALYTQQYDKVAGFSKSSGAGFQVGAKFNLNLGFNDFIGLQYYNSDEWSGVKLQIGQNF